MNTTSASLLQRLREPNALGAWDRFVELYTPLLFTWARRTGLQEPDAADVVQDVLVTLLERLPEFCYNPRQSFRTWLWTVTRNRCRKHFRSLAVRRGEPLMESTEDAQPDPADAVLEADYRAHLLARTLQVLRQDFEPATWQACWGHVVESRPAAEVAAELGLTVNAVYLAKSRVLRRLRQELAGLLD